MRTNQGIRAAAALTLILCAGQAVAQPEDRGARPASIDSRAGRADLRSCDWLKGRDVVNASGEEIAEVTDLIVDRGTGRIEHAVLTTGAILGMGGRSITVPYRELAWNAAEEKLTLSRTKEQLEQMPEFSAEAWSGLREVDSDDDRLTRYLTGDRDDKDDYEGALDSAAREHIEGEVTGVRRARGSAGEQVEIDVKTDSGETRRVVLGPSWYVNGAQVAPMRGDKVTIDAMALSRDPDRRLVATQVRTGERELVLRESGGTPLWTMKSARAAGHEYGTSYWKYILLSDLAGKKVECRGRECGDVDDVIIDRRSGEIALISIDPDENFLGVGDTERLVPWSVATVGLDGTVRLDASKEMVLASPETPSDLSELNKGDLAGRVYKAYDVPAPSFDTSYRSGEGNRADDWGHGGAILSSFQSSEDGTIDGKVVEWTQVDFQGAAAPARAIKISSDKGEQLILVGPTWYMDSQNLSYRPGDPVKVQAGRVTIGGKSYLLARTIDHNGQATVFLKDGNQPVWDRR